MSDLTEFLLARIAEDEYATLEPHRPWQWLFLDLSTASMRDRWASRDRRVYLECEAKRAIVALHGTAMVRSDGIDGDGMECNATVCKVCEWVDWPCQTLLALAQVYAEHPDFDEAWRL